VAAKFLSDMNRWRWNGFKNAELARARHVSRIAGDVFYFECAKDELDARP
jgi:hypothetical protein